MSISTTVGGFYPDYPTRCFEAKVDVEGAKLSSPTFAADGSRLFWADSADGIHTAALPRFGVAACGQLTDGGKLSSSRARRAAVRSVGAGGGSGAAADAPERPSRRARTDAGDRAHDTRRANGKTRCKHRQRRHGQGDAALHHRRQAQAQASASARR